MSKDWLITIGLEIHAQINSKYKLFSFSTNTTKQEDGGNLVPNSQVSFFDLGIPGTMPKLNKFCVIQAIRAGLALNGKVTKVSHFDRKHYFYPDLPNGFQITQFFTPIIDGGYIELANGKKVGIHHIHMEADAGQLVHKENNSLVNWNRAAVGLMEIVTEPHMESIEECIEFVKKLHLILKYTDSCNANMEEGNFRVDVNLSIRRNKEDPLGNRVEIKNMNSFRFIEAAIRYEIGRQSKEIEKGNKITQETRGFDMVNGTTYSLRDKETAPQYRYMWEPNLPPIVVTDEIIELVRKSLPMLPAAKTEYYKSFGLEGSIIDIFLEDFTMQQYFDNLIDHLKSKGKDDLVAMLANWIVGDLYAFSNKLEKSIEEYNGHYLISIITNIKDEKISGKVGKMILEKSIITKEDPMKIVEKEDLWQLVDTAIIDQYVAEVLVEQEKKYAEYKATGDEKIINFLTGSVIKKTGGKGAPLLCKERVLKAV